MPFTANRQFKDKPRLLAKASGMYYETQDGRRVLDAVAGLWCVNAGHGRKGITRAVAEQLEVMDYAPPFQVGHPAAFELASALVKIAPAGIEHVFFTNSGSESVDTALKIALAYHRVKGDAGRTRLLGRERGYHGVGFGGISVGGMVANRKVWPAAMIPGVDHLRHTHDPARNAFSKGLPAHGAEFADDLERLREICDAHGILLIFDEVITGFGRLGAPFAAQYFGVTPDLMTTAKGITNGVLPMGAVFASRTVHDAMMEGPEAAIEFFHGYTYSGHPVACAAGLATLEIYQREDLFSRAADLSAEWENAAHALRDAPHVVDIRNIGLMAAVELAPRPDAPGARGYEVLVKGLQAGVLFRATADTIALSPPLIIGSEEIDRLFSTLRSVLESIA
jgi:beta-alanine--pyruvate transaminase